MKLELAILLLFGAVASANNIRGSEERELKSDGWKTFGGRRSNRWYGGGGTRYYDGYGKSSKGTTRYYTSGGAGRRFDDVTVVLFEDDDERRTISCTTDLEDDLDYCVDVFVTSDEDDLQRDDEVYYVDKTTNCNTLRKNIEDDFGCTQTRTRYRYYEHYPYYDRNYYRGWYGGRRRGGRDGKDDTDKTPKSKKG
ncbi:predicted protein [Thalassiosira pseudonana CCMP1335]|uniref:Uncharacterized protein n=1 Tax=Thalassiosira pseudonana TaxID=35128 RepID=B8CGR6_THAPS|nr:predicted protein [Thalassiosira pseudonana CCMP1335]EED87414.1 predicted protein [Thalassiosira pseudonana CCMP1335]|eukprot:g4757.t1 g4757   contig16:259503-260283(-)